MEVWGKFLGCKRVHAFSTLCKSLPIGSFGVTGCIWQDVYFYVLNSTFSVQGRQVLEFHGDKRRGRMDIEDIGKEAQIHWNGPPLARANKLGEAALDRIFGKGRWDFTTLANRAESTVNKRLREEEASVPFFQLTVFTCSPCLLYTSPSPRDYAASRMPSSA